MRFDPDHLETLVAILDEGSFDAAARRLHLTPSAVSQRIRALEDAAGRVLVRRGSPATATEAGTALVRLGRELRLLDAEAAAVLAADAHPTALDLPVAVNADSLATWFRPVLGAIAARPGIALRLQVADETASAQLLRRGEVLAAVTTQSRAVQGCAVRPLGVQRYRAVAAPDLLARHRRGRGVDWARLPMVVFDELDGLQDRLLARRGLARPPVVHRIPSTADFLEAICAGLGWGMVPLAHVESAGARLHVLPGASTLDVALHWQRWRLRTPALDALDDAVLAAATTGLRRPRRSPSEEDQEPARA
ncbi:ArgP/LysG family DNA-binding transcriptional regulator [Nocardioides sp. TRM66260-LWL]|uniref:ArgP/LysG family DNA-binding transcriptional regulator n=1 Tax=Nocardioides sp. TRM66260-LWL TaxID=2874478 RepID=UPI001CC57483|nr:ArgP/LysG family DNA-binding transcriptional regulator [Nocardioides sp. TRM66260-LWL]MBZ5734471.1 ArgP/LysG family DNA-binding transcriptional regulator [Nocardioides sp. TRM66260-LWL]